MSNYQKFHNPPPYNNEGPILDQQQQGHHVYQPAPQPPPAIINSPSSFIQPKKRELKGWSTLKTLVRLELTLALLMIVFEAIIDGSVANLRYHYGAGPCGLGTGVWVGVLGTIAAALGWGAFRNQCGNKCLMVANFVMCIISAVADGIMIIFAGICLSSLPWMMRGSYDYNPELRSSIYKEASPDLISMVRGLIAVEAFLLLAAITHLISSIVSTAYICRNWCQESQPAVAVVYFPAGTNANQATVGNESDPCRIAVPSGAHVQQYVIFVPMGNSGQAVIQPSCMPGSVQQHQPQPEFRNVQGGPGDDKRV